MSELVFPPPAPGRVLIIDDEAPNVRVLRQALAAAGYRDVCWTTDPREAVAAVASERPDLILLDLMMPHVDGFEMMRRLAAFAAGGLHLPVLVLTADASADTKRRALASGATDFLTKPIDIVEVALRVRNLLQVRMLTRDLESQVRDRTRDLEAARLEMVERLAAAAEYRDDDTGEHTRRVGRMSARLAAELGLPACEAEVILQAAPLHDVGKIGVPDAILLKPGRLGPEELAVMRRHTEIGGRLLSGARFRVLQSAELIARTHHEHWDGSGYPAGLSREAIPLPGRIVAVADVYDALTHARPYKPAWSAEAALEEIRRQAGRQFDPDVVEAFLAVLARREALPA